MALIKLIDPANGGEALNPYDVLNPCRDCAIIRLSDCCFSCFGGNSQSEASYWSSLIGSSFVKTVGWANEQTVFTVIQLASREDDGDDIYLCQSGNSEPICEVASEIRRHQKLFGEPSC